MIGCGETVDVCLTPEFIRVPVAAFGRTPDRYQLGQDGRTLRNKKMLEGDKIIVDSRTARKFEEGLSK